jgi:hypothetical protein
MIIMTKGIYILVLLVSFFSAGIIRGQDINFSQFYELPLLRNPALAGIYKGDIRFTSAFRNQWQAVPVRYMTTAAGVETKIKIKKTKDYISIGAQLTNDVAGDGRLGKTQVLPILAYHKMINSQYNMYLTAGFMGEVLVSALTLLNFGLGINLLMVHIVLPIPQMQHLPIQVLRTGMRQQVFV